MRSPLAEKRIEEPPVEFTPAQPLRDRRIMVVEDEPLVAMVMQEVLEEHGAVVLGPFHRIEQASAFLAHNRLPDAAVLDVNIAGEAVYPIAALLDRNKVLFVFTTGGVSSDIPPAYAHIPYLEKPVDLEELLPLLTLARARA